MSNIGNIIAIHEALGGSGGGGSGGGAWKTIPVTFGNSGRGAYGVNLFCVQDNMFVNYIDVQADGSLIVDVLTYGDGVVYNLGKIISDVDFNVMPTATGGVSFDFQSGDLTITGAGTFTAAGTGGVR